MLQAQPPDVEQTSTPWPDTPLSQDHCRGVNALCLAQTRLGLVPRTCRLQQLRRLESPNLQCISHMPGGNCLRNHFSLPRQGSATGVILFKRAAAQITAMVHSDLHKLRRRLSAVSSTLKLASKLPACMAACFVQVSGGWGKTVSVATVLLTIERATASTPRPASHWSQYGPHWLVERTSHQRQRDSILGSYPLQICLASCYPCCCAIA